MSDELTQPDDLAILALLEALERKPGEGDAMFLPWAEGHTEDTENTLARLYAEVVGLLPYELPVATPALAVKARLMAIIAGDETQDVEPLVEAAAPAPALAPAFTPTPAEPLDLAALPAELPPLPATPEPAPALTSTPAVAPVRPAPAPRVATLAPSAPAPPAPPRAMPAISARRSRRWPLAAAAAIIIALLGLSAFLYHGLQVQGETISRLTQERDQLIAQEREHAKSAAATEAELARIQGEMSDYQTRLAFMTSPGVEISPLRPTGQVPMPENAFGMLFVASDHQHWHLSVTGLNPSGTGHQYQLWFIAPQGAVSAGTFTAAPGAPIHLSSAHMPAGTRGVIITLEPEAGVATPSGPEVLRAAPPVKIS